MALGPGGLPRLLGVNGGYGWQVGARALQRRALMREWARDEEGPSGGRSRPTPQGCTNLWATVLLCTCPTARVAPETGSPLVGPSPLGR